MLFFVYLYKNKERKKKERCIITKMPTDTVNKKTNRLVYVLSLLSLFFTFNMMNSNIVWGEKYSKTEAVEKAFDKLAHDLAKEQAAKYFGNEQDQNEAFDKTFTLTSTSGQGPSVPTNHKVQLVNYLLKDFGSFKTYVDSLTETTNYELDGAQGLHAKFKGKLNEYKLNPTQSATLSTFVTNNIFGDENFMNFFYKDKAALYVTQDVFKEAVAKKMVTKTLSVVTDKKPFGNVAEAVKAAVKELLEEEAKKQFQQDTDKQAKVVAEAMKTFDSNKKFEKTLEEEVQASKK